MWGMIARMQSLEMHRMAALACAAFHAEHCEPWFATLVCPSCQLVLVCQMRRLMVAFFYGLCSSMSPINRQ